MRGEKGRQDGRVDRAAEDHPRMRGEKHRATRFDHHLRGSPPHARGKVAGDGFVDYKAGITPACAGKRS